MQQLLELQNQLGLMTWPLILCSAVTVMIVIERLIQVVLSIATRTSSIKQTPVALPRGCHAFSTSRLC